MVWFGQKYPGKHEFDQSIVPLSDRYDGDVVFSPTPIFGGGSVVPVPRRQVPEQYLTKRQRIKSHPEQGRRKKRPRWPFTR